MTAETLSTWVGKSEQALAQLADRPWTLFFLLLTVNSIAQPYAGITHDARLYSAQVLNHVEGGAYADDLFFRYGSQDQYSLFSRLAAPLASGVGISFAFFVIYLVSKSTLVFGMMRIVQTLVPNRPAVVLALLYCMAVMLPYGGHHILKIQENFVTPRTFACGLVLFGLDLILRGRPVASFLALAFALAVHPLMACGGLLVWSGYYAWKYCGGRAFCLGILATCVLVTIVLAVEPLGKRCFGEMDDVWRQSILNASSFNFPSEWTMENWYCLAIQSVILGVAIWKYRSLDADKFRFVIVLALVTLAAVAGAILSERSPYALLLQGQPYRALWMLAFLHLAFAFWFCVEWSSQADVTRQLAGCALLAYLCSVDFITDEYVLPLGLFPILVLALRGLAKEPRTPEWFIRSVQISLVAGALAWMAYKFVLLATGTEDLYRRFPDYIDILEVFLVNLGPTFFIVLVCLTLVHFGSGFCSRSRFAAVLAAVCLLWQTFCFAFPHSDFYRVYCTRYRSDLKTLHALVHAADTPGKPLPTIYSNLGCLDYVWIDLHGKSYFDWWQAGNFMFRREMAMEGQRRACIVGPFEVDRYRKIEDTLTEGYKDAVSRFFKSDFERGPARKEDLARLCCEPDLDYVVIEQRFEDLYIAQAGSLYLYRCDQVRTALNLPKPRTTIALASRPNEQRTK